MAKKANIGIDQYADKTVTFSFCLPGPNDVTPGAPIPVTGYTALMQLRSGPGTVLLLTLTDTDGITVGTTDGTFTVDITKLQTAGLVQDCKYDLLVTAPDGTATRLAEGTVILDPAISVPS